MPSPAPLTISFVSGKGGVGKTSLAANFAYLCSSIDKTVLIDLDLQNQGCTGMFLHFLDFEGSGAFGFLLNPSSSLISSAVLDNVCVVPAVSLKSPPSNNAIASMVQQRDFEDRLEMLLKRYRADHNVGFIILDCHGGLDFVSLAAHRLSDHTVVVTEADAVTLNGTLELLDFYQCSEIAMRAAVGQTTSRHLEVVRGAERAASPPKHVSLLINRLPPKYCWKDLQEIYGNLYEEYGLDLRLQPEPLAYIPEEPFIADSFGEYPFWIKLAPQSIVAKKIRLIAYKLFGQGVEAKVFEAFKSDRYRKAVEQSVIADETRNIQSIVSAFTAIVCMYSFVLLALAVWLTKRAVSGAANSGAELYALGVAYLVLATVGLIFTLRACYGLKNYFRMKHQFRKALIKSRGSPPTIWERLSITKLLVIRVAAFVPIALMWLCLFSVGSFVVIELANPALLK